MSYILFEIKRLKFRININAFLMIIATIISSINTNIYFDQSSLNYKPILLRNKKILIINQYGIYTYSRGQMKIEQKYDFKAEFPSLLSKADYEHIFIFENILPKNITFIFIKNFLFISSEKGEIIHKNKFFDANLKNYNILFYSNITTTNTSSYYYYILFYKKSNSIVVIDLFEYNYYLNLINALFSKNINISKAFNETKPNLEENFSCEFMSRTNSKDIFLACFLENDHQIKSKVYKIDFEKKNFFFFPKKKLILI